MQRFSQLFLFPARINDQQYPLLAVQVNTVTWFLVIALAFRILARIVLPAAMLENWSAVFIAGLLLLFSLIHYLNYRGRCELAGIILNVGLWGIVNYEAWMQGGIDASIFLANILILFSTGLMLGFNAALITVLTTLIWGLFLFWEKLKGVIPQPVLKESAPVFIRMMLETHQLTLEESQPEGVA